MKPRPYRTFFTEFQWPVLGQGYEWHQGKVLSVGRTGRQAKASVPDGFLMPSVSARPTTRRYNPFRETTGLFRQFAETTPTEAGIKLFADRYGLLGDEEVRATMATEGPRQRGAALGRNGERLAGWNGQIARMQQAVRLWGMVQSGNIAGLAQYIKWDGDQAVSYQGPPDLYLIASAEESPEQLTKYTPGDVLRPAQTYVQWLTNRMLTTRASPRLLWDTEPDRLSLHLVPRNLLGALWLQFARAIDGNREFRQCRQCYTWLELSPEIARTNRKYCTDACRLRAFRARKEDQAQQEVRPRKKQQSSRPANQPRRAP